MKRNYFYLFGFLALTSCSIHREIKQETNNHNPEVTPSTVGMVIKPIVADLKVGSTKLSVTYTADLKLPLNEIKDNAMELFLTTAKCDYVVDPVYSKITTIENSKLSQIQITITGYPATYAKVYQVDSLPKSVIQYSSISLPVKRVDYTNYIKSETKGKSLGIEFITGIDASLNSFMSAQLDLAKNYNGLHYYFSIDKYSDPGNVSFDYQGQYSIINTSVSFDQTILSLGIFKEKIFSNSFKIRALGGLNYSSMPFTQNQYSNSGKTTFESCSSIGIRFGGAMDYRINEGISFIFKAHANVGVINSVSQIGENVTVSNINFNDFPVINLSTGFRFNF